MENYYEFILDNKIYIKRTEFSKLTIFSLDGTIDSTFEELPIEAKKIIKANDELANNPDDYLEYEINDNKVTITKINKDIGIYIKIPSHIKGLSVTKIGTDIAVAYGGLSVKQFQLPYTLEEISPGAFQMSAIEYVNIPPNITKIPEKCFSNSDIKKIDLSHVKYIDSGAFTNCKYLKEVDLSAVDYLNSSTFNYCQNLESVILPKNIETIPEFAFYNCPNLKNIKCGNNIKKIDNFAFSNCGIENIDLPDSLEKIEPFAFHGCSKLKEFIAPKNLVSIGKNAFEYCENLSKLSLNEKLYFIGTESFKETNLSSVIMPSNTNYGNNSFAECIKIIRAQEVSKEER